MLRLRPYKPCDAETIVSWFENDDIFYKWGGNLIGEYPLAAETLNEKYLKQNGGCKETDNFYPMTAFDEKGVVGHFIMRYINGNNKNLRFGWVILDPKRRGKGYGKDMITLGLKYAFDILRVQRVTIGVFENNEAAYHCYEAAGFHINHETEGAVILIKGEEWKVIEMEITEEKYKGI